MAFRKNYSSVSQQLEEAYEIVRYQNHKLNTLKDAVANIMDGLDIMKYFEDRSDSKESLEQMYAYLNDVAHRALSNICIIQSPRACVLPTH
ncbi:hypothetical protein LTR97_011514 [Elasticomyces elasticus]|uniref:Uncharacterized protein n=1 Tax=Elasticomyces elasticus TaxID=574655 RepID=A0AAN7VYP3_9PEZI|nr:hypothetical protein LTR97_011514 [Elasticomyces elasticus]